MKSMNDLIVIGAGGHSKVIFDAVQKQGVYRIVAFVDTTLDLPRTQGQVPVLTALPDDCEGKYFIVAIGDNVTRARLFAEMQAKGLRPATVVHPNSTIAGTATIGLGSIVCPGVIIGPDTVIGINSILNTASSIDHDCQIGEHVHIGPGSTIAGSCHIAEGAFVGSGTVLIPHVKIGKWATVGAGSVLIRDVSEKTTVVGLNRVIHQD